MKKYLILLFFLIISGLSIAQAPPPPPDNVGTGNGPVGGGNAPVGDDVTCLLAMAIGYAGLCFLIKKYHARKEVQQQT